MENFNDDSRYNLYQKFKEEAVMVGINNLYYDECDLVEIFDYAGDHDDNAVRAEVLALGARLYPGSDDLKIRKVLYYFAIEEYEMCRSIIESPHSDGLLWDVVKMRLDAMEIDNVDEALDGLLVKYETMQDEDIIQLIGLANSLGRLQWAIDKVDYFRSKTTYMPTVLYEIAILSGMHGDTATVVKMTEELTKLEPFNELYWVIQARALGDQCQEKQALSAIDYALAINPENSEALLIRAQLRVLDESVDNALVEDVKKVIEREPDNELAYKTLAVLYQAMDDDDGAFGTYVSYLKFHPIDLDILEQALDAKPSRELVEKYLDEESDPIEGELLAIAERLCRHDALESAAVLLDVYHTRHGLTYGFEYYITLLYMTKRYDNIVSMLAKSKDKIINSEHSPIVSFCYAMSLVRKDKVKQAKTYIKKWLDTYSERFMSTPKERLTATGVKVMMDEFYYALQDGDKEYVERIDPFTPLIPGASVY